MTKSFGISLLFLCLALNGRAQELSGLLKELDRAISYRESYVSNKESRIREYKESVSSDITPENYLIFKSLFDEYYKYDIDSAFKYANRKLDLAKNLKDEDLTHSSRMDLADVYIMAGMYSDAKTIVENERIHDAMYYHVQHSLNTVMYQSAVLTGNKDKYHSLMCQYRDSLIATLPVGDFGYLYALSEKLNENGNHYEASLILTDRYNDPETPESTKAILNFSLAVAHQGLNNREMAERYYAMSAIEDMTNCVKDYRSLHILAYMLFEDGDLSRAYRYVSRAMDDFKESNVRVRIEEFYPLFTIINDAYQKEISKRNSMMSIGIIALSVLLILVLVFATLMMHLRSGIKRSKQKLDSSFAELKDADQKLLQISNELQEAGKIKEEYLYRFMEYASNYIDQLERYRMKLTLTYRKYGEKKLLTELEKPFDVDEELRMFYNSFDEAFLHLFPDFIQDVNGLLDSEHQIQPKPGRLMNTGLRILALIRLGVTDSVQISHFLRTSLSTVYNYRTKMRNSSICNRNDFEERISKIGIVNL